MATTSIDREVAAPDNVHEIPTQPFAIYVCPKCKGALEARADSLHCRACAISYPIREGIPDFLVTGELESSPSRDLHKIARHDGHGLMEFAARNYEKYIYPPVANLFGGWHSTSLAELARNVSDIVGQTSGVILDVGCGPGTYGRRVAAPSRTVYGADPCLSMLHLLNVHFSRALVEELPFPDNVFDAAICAGALNHFYDTVAALREIHRTMKPGAPLAVMCFVVSNHGLLKFQSLRERIEKRSTGHISTVADLERYSAEAGFENFRPRLHGAIIVFSARKRAAEK